MRRPKRCVVVVYMLHSALSRLLMISSIHMSPVHAQRASTVLGVFAWGDPENLR